MTELDKFIETYALQLSAAIKKMINEIEKLVDIGDSFINNNKLSQQETILVSLMQSDIFKFHIWELLMCVPEFARNNLLDKIMDGIAHDEREKNRSVH
jgi:hypothetical protein